MKERLHSLLAPEQYTQPNLALRNLLTDKDENLRNLWQDKEFLFAFPKMAIFLISSEGRMEFFQDQRIQIFSDSLQIFLSNDTRQLSGYRFTKNGEIVTRNRLGFHKIGSISEPNTITLETGGKTDSYPITVIASIMLIGMSLKDQELLTSLASQSYQELSLGKRGYLIDNLGRLLQTNNPTRAYIKDNKLDIANGFDWDADLAYILFFGIYKYVQKSPGQRLPQEMKDIMLKYYSLEALNVILDYALDQSEHLQRLRKSAELRGFINYIATLLANAQGDLDHQEMIKGMQEKLDGLKEAISYKQIKSPITLDSSPNGEIVYAHRYKKPS